jgi:hypothetical protein
MGGTLEHLGNVIHINCVRKSEGKTPFGNIGTELRIILERISKDKL